MPKNTYTSLPSKYTVCELCDSHLTATMLASTCINRIAED